MVSMSVCEVCRCSDQLDEGIHRAVQRAVYIGNMLYFALVSEARMSQPAAVAVSAKDHSEQLRT